MKFEIRVVGEDWNGVRWSIPQPELGTFDSEIEAELAKDNYQRTAEFANRQLVICQKQT